MPTASSRSPVSGLYKYLASASAQRLVYHVTNTAVIVVAVFHGARDLARALAERRKDIPDRS